MSEWVASALRQRAAIVLTGVTFAVLASALLAAVASPHAASATAAAKVYWANPLHDKIQRSNVDGTNVEDVIVGLHAAGDLAIDDAGGKMYWVNGASGKIQRANLDGSGLEDLVTGLSNPWTIDLDVAAGKMYWTVGAPSGPGKIQRADLNGSAVQDVLLDLARPLAVAVDPSDGKIYWTQWNQVRRANLDGTGVEDVLTTTGYFTTDIALDMGAGDVYYTAVVPDTVGGIWAVVGRARLDSSHVENLAFGTMAQGVALDLSGGKVYWTDSVDRHVRRANLDGSDGEELVTGVGPYGIALDYPPSVPLPTLAPTPAPTATPGPVGGMGSYAHPPPSETAGMPVLDTALSLLAAAVGAAALGLAAQRGKSRAEE